VWRRMKKTVEQRFWEKVGPHDDPTKCWIWLGASHKQTTLSYGELRVGDKVMLAHRLSYEMYYHVIIPKGMTIDHVKALGCTSTLCVNPHHLEVVTQKVNVLRGNAPSALNAKKTHCSQGHPYNTENTYVWHGERYCRVCHKEQQQKTIQEDLLQEPSPGTFPLMHILLP